MLPSGLHVLLLSRALFSLQVLVGNKCDMDESKRAVPFSKGQALADELGIQFFETSAKNNTNVTEVQPRLGHGPASLHCLCL